MPFPNLSYNFVAAARQQGSKPVVLKMGVPNKELESEAASLEIYDGKGAVKLLDQDLERGALLLERLRPGESLWSTWRLETDEKQTEIAAICMMLLWQPGTPRFPTTADWLRALPGYLHRFPSEGPLPRQWVDKAIGLSSDLEKQTKEPVLLHGDLHHGNILSGWNEWKAIDPKGVVGDPAFEIGAWLRNPMDRILQVPNMRDLTDRRLRILAEITGLDISRLRAWSFCACILSACWSTEAEGEGENWDVALACAEVLQSWL